MTPELRRGGVALAALVLAVAALWLDPAGTIRPEALARFAFSGAVAVGGLWAATGAGAALLRWRAPELLDGPAGWLFALGTGIGLHGAVQFLLAAVGAAGTVGSVAALVALACGWIARPDPGRPRPGPLALAVGAVAFLPALLEAMAPPTDTDELYQHLALAREIAESGGLVGGFAHPDGSRPLPIHVVLAGLYAVGGEAAPRLWNLGIAAALALGVRDLADARFGKGRGALPALALLGSFTFVREAGMAYNTHVVALWLLLAAEAMLERRWEAMGWMCGLALAGRYNAAPVVAGLFAVAARDAGRPSLRGLVHACVAALLPLVPWWARNVWDGLHPLFPFAGWPESAGFVFVYLDKYGAGRAPLDWLLLPWNLLVKAEVDSFTFLGRLNLAWAALAGAGLWAAFRGDGTARRLAIVLAAGFVGWALGPQILRYLMPLAGIAGLLGGALRPGWPPLLLLLVSLPSNLGPVWARAASRAAVATGNERREDFLERELTAWPALAFLREHVPADARVALLFAWHGYYVPQDWVLGSVEDHVPTRWWLWSHGDRSLADLADQGITHVFVGDIRFIKKSYAFLPPTVLQEQFQAPEKRLRELLLREGSRLFAANRWEVWRIESPRTPAAGDGVPETPPTPDLPAPPPGEVAPVAPPPGAAAPGAPGALDAPAPPP